MYPEQFFHTIRQKLKKEWSFAFCTAFCAGLLIHLYRLSNHLLTWDSVYNFHDSQNVIHLGRCFLTLSCGIGSYYDLQWVNGLLSLVYLSLTAVCLTELFSLCSRTSIALVAGIVVSFPSVASTFAYMYTADGYFLAQLTAALAVLLTLKYKKGFLAGILLLAFSYGSYQAYISFAVMLILVWSVLQLMKQTFSVRELLSYYWLRFLLMGGAGTALYLLCNQILTALEGASASDYNGISTMSLPDGARLVSAVGNCIVDFVYFFFGPLGRMNFYQLLNAALFVLLASLFVWAVRQKKLLKKPGRLLMMLLCLAAMPFVCSMIYFLSPEVRYYMLMYAGFSLIYMLPVLFYDALIADGTNVQAAPSVDAAQCSFKSAGSAGQNAPNSAAALPLSWCCVIVTVLTIFNFALIDNISYLYMTTSNEKTFHLVSRMTDRIEQLDDFKSAEKLCVIGHFEDYDTISLNLPPAMAGVRDSYMISEQAHFAAMMDTYFGLTLESCSDEEKEEILSSELFAKMGRWPAAGSVRQYGNTVVIRIE